MTIALVATLALPAIAGATTRRVPSQYPTIHQALDAAASGDSVLVAPGTYTATITRTILLPGGSIPFRAAGFLKDGVTLISEQGPAVTNITVNTTGTNVHCLVAAGSLTAGTPARVEGFTFRKPNASWAAILVRDNAGASTLEVRRCAFLSIPGGTQAGGIYSSSGNLVVQASTFSACSGNAAGGLASVDLYSSVAITDCTFQACTSTVTSGGATIDGAQARVKGSFFKSCQGAYGGGFATTTYDLNVEDSRFEDNIDYGSGSALRWVRSGGHGWVRGCTFLRNRATGVGGLGGAMGWFNVLGDVSNCTFVGNFTANGASAMWFTAPGAIFRNNIVTGNQGGTAVVFGTSSMVDGCNVYWDNPLGHLDAPIGLTSRVADPQFCDAATYDYRVRETSPCAAENSEGCGHIGALKVGCGPLPVIVETTPEQGLLLVIDGVVRPTPYYPDPASWSPGTQHSIGAIPIQDGGIGHTTQYWKYKRWNDDGDTSHVVTVPPEPVRYSATYVLEAKTQVSIGATPLASLDTLADGLLVTGYLYWIPGTTHTIEAVSPQPDTPGYEWRFDSWSDGGARVHDVTAPTVFAAYTAAFSRHHLDGVLVNTSPPGLRIRVNADTVATPKFFTPLQWPPGSPRTVQAITPQQESLMYEYAFVSWSDGADTTHVVTPPVGPYDLVATYLLEQKPLCQVLSDPMGRTVVVDGQNKTTPTGAFWSRGSVHTIGVNSPQPGAPGIEYHFTAWSDSGAAYHNVVVPLGGLNPIAFFAADTLPGIVLRTVASELSMKADGVSYTTPKYLPWTQGSVHTLAVDSTQYNGVPYLFDQWDDGTTARTRAFVQPAGQTSVTAIYSRNDFFPVTIQTTVPGMLIRADGVQYHAPTTLLWLWFSAHTVELDSLVMGPPGTHYLFQRWDDNPNQGRTRTITVPGPSTFTGLYKTEFELAMNADPGGTVTPLTAYRDSAVAIQIQATPVPGSRFRDWVGTGIGSYTGTQNPRTITLGGPITETARFYDVAFEFSLSLSDTDPHVHTGAPIGTGPVHLWLVCSSGAGATRFQARPSGDLQALAFQTAPGVFDAGSGGDIDLSFPCAQGPLRLGQFFVLDPSGGELCLAPSQTFGRLAAIDCTGPPDVVYAWPEDLHIDGIATNGAIPCASGRSCVTPSPVLPMDFVSSLDAAEVDRAVEIRWSTSGEAVADGFRVYRSERASGGFHSLNTGLVHGTSTFVWRDTDVSPQTMYFYLLGAFDAEGREQRVGPVSVQTGILRPLEFAFDAVRPNPFVRRTELNFMVPTSSRVVCSVFDVSGRLVGTILDATYPAGVHRVAWEGRDLSGKRMTAGVYFLRLSAGPTSSTRKVVMLEGN